MSKIKNRLVLYCVCVCGPFVMYSDMPPKRVAGAKGEAKPKAKSNKDNASDDIIRILCLRRAQAPPKPHVVDEGTKEYYLMQINELENRVAR